MSAVACCHIDADYLHINACDRISPEIDLQSLMMAMTSFATLELPYFRK